MKIEKYTDTVQSRSCEGEGLYVTDLCKLNLPIESTVRFSITSDGDNYVINMSSEDLGVMIATVINSDHILIMKQILKEMGEI